MKKLVDDLRGVAESLKITHKNLEKKSPKDWEVFSVQRGAERLLDLADSLEDRRTEAINQLK
jgi:hypothetical protein